MKEALATVVAALVLTGCTSTPSIGDQFNSLMESSQCDAAQQLVLNNYLGAGRYYLSALIELDCRNNRQAGLDLLELCASMGHENAAGRLRQLGVVTPMRAAPLPPVQISSSLLAPVVPAGASASTSSRQTRPAQTLSNVYLRRTEEVIGARLCHYSNGTVVRINGGMTCSPTN